MKEINGLHFLLNITTFFPTVKVETIVQEIQTKTLKHDFASLHLIVEQLSKLQTLSSMKVYKSITVTLGLDFSERINETTPIFVQWTYLHWFLQFLSSFALFPVKRGHRTMEIMKYMSGLSLDSASPQSLPMSFEQQSMPVSLPDHRFAKTCYSLNIADIKMPNSNSFLKEDVLALKRFSEIIKLCQKTRVDSK